MQKDDNSPNSIEQMLILLSLYEDGRLDNKDELSENEKRQLEAARETEKFLDMIPGGFFIYHANEDQTLIYANKATLKIFGCDNLQEFRKMTGNSFLGIVHPDDFSVIEQSINDQISSSNEKLDYVEYRIIRKDGTVRWVEDYGQLVHSAAVGDIFYVFISDATDRINRQLSEKHKKEQRLQSLIEEQDKERIQYKQEELRRLKVIEGLSINYDTILYADLDKDELIPYRFSKRAAEYFDKKLQVKNFAENMKNYANTWVHPEDREIITETSNIEYLRKELSKKNSVCVNYRCIEEGVTKFLQLLIVNVGNKDSVDQIVLGYRKIDEEIANEIKQKAVLEEALKRAKLASVAKDTFLSNMSHDMRTPLNAIFGYTALAGKNPGDTELVKKYLDKIDTASHQILDLITNVLELAYIGSQDFRLNENECDVCQIAKEVQQEIIPQANAKNIIVTLHTDTVNSGVYADDEKLKQLLRHLADNAVKYTKDGGTVDISVTQRKTDPSSDFSSFEFKVKDTGRGISKEALPHIFEPFERENNTTHAGIYGLGVGLTIVKQIADAMGGSIKAESEVGKGSTFTAVFDLRLIKSGSEDKTSSLPLDLTGKKILIVEDNFINLDLETELLTDLGCIVDSAPNGKVGVEKVQASKPNEYFFVLMDIQMPVMDGRQASQEIRKLDNPELANIPIIALSANAFESDIKASLDAGMDAHLTKPIDIPLLLKTIETVIRG